MKKVFYVLLAGAMSAAMMTAAYAAPKAGDATIGMSGAAGSIYTANMCKYGGDTVISIPIKKPAGTGTLRLVDKIIVDGEDVIRKVSLKNDRLVVEAKFPNDLLEPEDYAVDMTLRLSDSQEETTCRVEGTVYWQDTAGPVDPDEYREKKYVIIDFENNSDEEIRFKGGSLFTDGLESGTANLDISYSSDSYDNTFGGKEEHYVRFTASPKLDKNVTVSFDAEPGNCIYEMRSGKPVKVNAKYSALDHTLSFKTRRLGEYVLASTELDQSSMANPPASSSTVSGNVASGPNASAEQPVKENPGTGAYPLH